MTEGNSIKEIINEATLDARTVSLVGYLAKEDDHQLWI